MIIKTKLKYYKILKCCQNIALILAKNIPNIISILPKGFPDIICVMDFKRWINYYDNPIQILPNIVNIDKIFPNYWQKYTKYYPLPRKGD